MIAILVGFVVVHIIGATLRANPSFQLARIPFAGVVLLYGVGAKPPPDGV
jgi:hypothetical protein